MKILICDDEREVLHNTRDRVEKILVKIFPQEAHSVYAFENIFSLYDYLEKRDFIADGIFMDINLEAENETNGIDVAVRIRKIKNNVKIIFYTGNIRYAESIFRAEPFDFAVKPVSNERLIEILVRLKESIDRDSEKTVTIKGVKGIYKIMLSEISYVESEGRYVHIHTETEKITAINKLDNILQILGKGFVRCHKSYIVNVNKLRQYTTDRVVLLDRTEILVSRKYRQEIKAAILGSV